MQKYNNKKNMKVTKENVQEIIDNILKIKKVKYNIISSGEDGLFYEIFISSLEVYIQVEFSLNDESLLIQFYTKVDMYGYSLYHAIWENLKDVEDEIYELETEIDDLLNSVIQQNKGLSKITQKIEQIKDICEEYGFNFDELISVKFEID